MNHSDFLIFDAFSIMFFSLYLIFQLFLFFIYEPAYVSDLGVKEKKKRKIPIYVDTPKSKSEILGNIIEYGLFNKYSFLGYKNSVRGNQRIFAVILASIPIVIFFYWSIRLFTLIGLIRDPSLPLNLKDCLPLFLGFWGFIISYFLLERGHNYKKWEYLAGLYNILISKNTKNDETYNFLKAALVLDLIEMEMWSHNSFYEIFKDVIEQHYLYYRNVWSDGNSKRKFSEIKEDLYKFGLTKEQAIAVALYAQKREISTSQKKADKIWNQNKTS